ncbi:GGDEF domain-containing protein [Sphingopyxis indica]|uniref:sensor domain-containing diguanylate cyclase n=1 Tax=Sphingopyxis indica TaxID=436663 RepID=UPI002938F546|nr:diguanylate cyclase [Sphingopyxis indica]WOF44612.1 GGDEF domain-containing protein [Sphingopyxis indica]
MTTHATSSGEPVGRLLGWLGLRPGRSGIAADPGAPPDGNPSRVRQVRADLIEAIGRFLLDNDLDVSPANLVIAHGAFSGSNPRLARQVAARAVTHGGVTQQWIDEICGEEADPKGQADLDRLMAKLETNLEAFQTRSKAAHQMTRDYGSELEEHLTDLEQLQKTGQIVSNLADLAKAMLERTRKAEDEMRKSEDEAKSLRRNLARAKRDAEVDYLTGLPNRRAFEALFERHYREGKETPFALSVAFCDIDNFKAINDIHGHDAGDRVLKVIADTLAQISNDNCHVARHGGEEFVMLFRGLTPREVAKKLDDARERLADRRLINRKTDQPFGVITFSGGVADVFGYPEPRAALKAADEALFRAKQAGRNRIEIA